MADPNIRSFYEGDRSRTEVDGSYPVIQPLTARDQLMQMMAEEKKMLPRLTTPLRPASPGVRAARPSPLPDESANQARLARERQFLDQVGQRALSRSPTPAEFGRFQMNHTGNWGTFVDPANIPANLQGVIMGGMYGQAGNWDSTNPQIMGPQQFQTGKYRNSGGGVSMPGQLAPEKEESNSGFDHLTPLEQARWLDAMRRS